MIAPSFGAGGVVEDVGGASLIVMDGAGAFAEGAGVTGGAEGLDLGEDGEGNFFGRAAAEVEADGTVQAGEHVRGDVERSVHVTSSPGRGLRGAPRDRIAMALPQALRA